MYTNGGAMSATGFVSDTDILSYPVEQSILKLLNVFNHRCLFRGDKEFFSTVTR